MRNILCRGLNFKDQIRARDLFFKRKLKIEWQKDFNN